MAKRNRRKPSPEERRVRRTRRIRYWVHGPFRLLVLTVLGVGLGVGAYEIAGFLYTSPALAVRYIEVRGTHRTRVEDLLQAGHLQEGMNIFQADLDAIQKRVAALPWVRQASVSRVIPETMIVEVVEYQPVAVINLGALYYVDKNREVFKRVQPGEQVDFPVLTGISREDFRDAPLRVDRSIAYSLGLLAHLGSFPCLEGREVAEIHFDELMGPTVVFDPGAISVRLGGEHPERRLPLLCRLLDRIAESNLKPHTILLDHGNRPGWATVRLERPQVASTEQHSIQESIPK